MSFAKNVRIQSSPPLVTGMNATYPKTPLGPHLDPYIYPYGYGAPHRLVFDQIQPPAEQFVYMNQPGQPLHAPLHMGIHSMRRGQTDEYDGMEYNVHVAHNRSSVLTDFDVDCVDNDGGTQGVSDSCQTSGNACSDVSGTHGDGGFTSCKKPRQSTKRRGQTWASVRGCQMPISGDRRTDPTWAPCDTGVVG